MENDKDLKEIMQKMKQIKTMVEKGGNNIKDIKYCDDLQLGQIGIEGAYKVVIQDEERDKVIGERLKKVKYKIYTEDCIPVANIDEKGNVEFTDEYLKQLKEIDEEQLKQIDTDNVQIETESKEQDKDKDETKEISYNDINKKEENEKVEEMSKIKGVPKNNILIVKEDSNLYKDHPELKEEPNLYFYRDNDGTIKAEYIDQEGNVQASEFFNDSIDGKTEEIIDIRIRWKSYKKRNISLHNDYKS